MQAWREALRASPDTHALVERQLALWPEHEPFLARSFAERNPATLSITEDTARQITHIVGDQLDEYCRGYRWMCEAVLQEELYFRRHGRYQATSFAAVAKAVYDDPAVMQLYMDGLLLSQVFWRNHVDVELFYRRYLEGLPPDYAHLEIGPGHGLLLAHAASDLRCRQASAWDISDASLAATGRCLARMGVASPVILEKRNIFELSGAHEHYQSVVVSEVLEHLEDPERALQAVRRVLDPAGRAFINIPCNSPAPDHLYLFTSPDHFFGMLTASGFRIVEQLVTPSTGWSLERALRQKLALSCVAIVECASEE